jgi:hypothetical protein
MTVQTPLLCTLSASYKGVSSYVWNMSNLLLAAQTIKFSVGCQAMCVGFDAIYYMEFHPCCRPTSGHPDLQDCEMDSVITSLPRINLKAHRYGMKSLLILVCRTFSVYFREQNC